jgi:hypothetical protein
VGGVPTSAAASAAILYPEDEYGLSFKDRFWEAVEANGGTVVGVEKYPPGSVDWQPEIKRLVGLAHLSRDQQALVDERNKLRRRAADNADKLASPRFQGLPPYVDFDAVFIPDDAPSVGLILPQLRFFDVRDVVYLGGSGWNDPALVKIAGREAQRAVFTDEFFAGSQRRGRRVRAPLRRRVRRCRTSTPRRATTPRRCSACWRRRLPDGEWCATACCRSTRPRRSACSHSTRRARAQVHSSSDRARTPSSPPAARVRASLNQDRAARRRFLFSWKAMPPAPSRFLVSYRSCPFATPSSSRR